MAPGEPGRSRHKAKLGSCTLNPGQPGSAHTRAHTHTDAYMYTHAHNAHIYRYMRAHIHMCTQTYAHNTYAYTYMCTHIHMHIHPPTHTEDELTEHADFMKNQNKTARHDQSIHQRTAAALMTPATPSACSLSQSVTLTCGTGVVLRLTAPAPSCLPGWGMGWGAPQLGKWPSPPPPAAEGMRKDRGLPLSLLPESQIPCCFVVPGAVLHTAIPLIS